MRDTSLPAAPEEFSGGEPGGEPSATDQAPAEGAPSAMDSLFGPELSPDIADAPLLEASEFYGTISPDGTTDFAGSSITALDPSTLPELDAGGEEPPATDDTGMFLPDGTDWAGMG